MFFALLQHHLVIQGLGQGVSFVCQDNEITVIIISLIIAIIDLTFGCGQELQALSESTRVHRLASRLINVICFLLLMLLANVLGLGEGRFEATETRVG